MPRTGNAEALARWRADGGVPHNKGSWHDRPTVRDEKSGCLLWQGSISPQGYARYGPSYVHRLVWIEAHGEISSGYQIDHVAERGCVHRHCIELAHLEAVSQADNIRRQPNVIAQMARTHCPQGHPYDEENTMIRKRGNSTKRECRQCGRDRMARNAASKVSW